MTSPPGRGAGNLERWFTHEPWFTGEPPHKGFPLALALITLDGKVRVRQAIGPGNQGREQMRNNKNKSHKNRTGRGVANAVADPPVYIAEQRPTVRQGLRILARVIARAHLRRQAERSGAPAPGPPPAGESGE